MDFILILIALCASIYIIIMVLKGIGAFFRGIGQIIMKLLTR